MRAEEEEAKAGITQSEAARKCHLRMATLYRRAALNSGPHSLGDCQLSPSQPTFS
jgi:hypothetical protein